MAVVVDTSVWVDFLRIKTPESTRQIATEIVIQPDISLCEPILFELKRATPKPERRKLTSLLGTFPVLTTPANLWADAAILGQKCADKGFSPRPLDLLISTICLFHSIAICTFDRDFKRIGEISGLKVDVVERS